MSTLCLPQTHDLLHQVTMRMKESWLDSTKAKSASVLLKLLARLSDPKSRDQFSVIHKEAEGRTAAEHFVVTTFAEHYGASVTRFMPHLVTLVRKAKIEAVAGFRHAAEQPLFLERYLDVPVEECVSQLTGHPVMRSDIVEIGQMAAGIPGTGSTLMLHLMRYLVSQGHTWIVFTATKELREILGRLGLPLFAVAQGDPARLGEQASDWGRYYDHHPLVVCASLEYVAHRLTQISDLEQQQ